MKHKFAVALAIGSALWITFSCSLFSRPRGDLVFQPGSLPAAQVGAAYEARVTISGNVTPAGDFSISKGALPPGLALEKVQGGNSARIFGAPEQPGTYKFTVFVWCYGTNVSGQVGQKEYTLVVK